MTIQIKDKYIPTIPREDLVHINFIDIIQPSPIKLKRYLMNALKVGNAGKIKVKITFKTSNGILCTKTTIWMVGKDYVLVKGNIAIPIKSIIKVE